MPLLRSLLAVVAPPLCFGCRRHATREPLCGACRAELAWLGPEPFACGPVAAWAPLAYDGPARALVRGLKFGGAAGLSEVMAAQLAANAPDGLLAGFDLVPVPLHPRRRRKRGYNQAERLASALADAIGPRGQRLPRAARVARHAGGPPARAAPRGDSRPGGP